MAIGLRFFLSVAAAALLSSGCSTIMFVRTPETQTFTEPVFQASRPFFVFGALGADQEFFLDRVCLGRDVDQIATTYTTSDVLKGVLTLGIYTPRTLQVWCQL